MKTLTRPGHLSISRIFTFEMAHVLSNHHGLCKNLHGHSYKLHISLSGKIIDEPDAANDGMIMDFGELKEIVNQHILSKFDHTLVVYQKAANAQDLLNLPFERIEVLNFQPTCENLVLHFVHLLELNLPKRLKLYKLRLYETANSYSEWQA